MGKREKQKPRTIEEIESLIDRAAEQGMNVVQMLRFLQDEGVSTPEYSRCIVRPRPKKKGKRP